MILIVTSQLSAAMRMVFEDLIREHCTKYFIYEIDKSDIPLTKVIETLPPTAVIAMGRNAKVTAKEVFNDWDIPKKALSFLPADIVGYTTSLDILMVENPKRQIFTQLLDELRVPPKTAISELPPEQVFPPEVLELDIQGLTQLLNEQFSVGKPYIVLLPDNRKLAIVPDNVKPEGYDYVFTVGEAILLIQAHQLFRAKPLTITDRYGAQLPLT